MTSRPLLCSVFVLAVSAGVVALESRALETGGEARPGEREVQAMARAYPGRIEATAYRDGEWALLMDGRWFYWSEGRLLPREHRREWRDFVSIRFYNYQTGPLREREITPELEDRLRSRMASFSNDGMVRFNDFLDTLYGIHSRQDAERIMRTVEFLGHTTRVHPLLVGPLQRVDERLRAMILVDGRTREFVRDLVQVHGYNWRNIAGTPRRSYHSYGIALDLMPRSFRRRYAYWRWAVDGGVEEWWNLPVSSRWEVPQPVIDAFEAEGFIWGGKWLSFDNIHFEYRPEIILLAD
ncbi:MAG: M15 family peptidase [Spirochaetaceae bacterium]|nr:MAG: M15 family peptidase [Spirochaetaceae bacterium]